MIKKSKVDIYSSVSLGIIFSIIAAIYEVFVTADSFLAIGAIIYSPAIIVIFLLSYFLGKNIAIYNQSRKKTFESSFKGLVIVLLATSVLGIIFTIFWTGYPIMEGYSYQTKVSVFEKFIKNTGYSAVCLIPALIASLRKYSIKEIRAASSTELNVKKRKKSKKSDDFEEL